MKRMPPAVLKLEVGFADKEKTLRMLKALASDSRVGVNILKARITDQSAWLELELTGQSPRIFEVGDLLNEAACLKDPAWKPHSRAS
ncbi:MAG TPA: hypothetical protein VEN81_01680 [Planctomycetota bacterium]|nr:hypothetical protein [Planctomycetota bacterium]